MADRLRLAASSWLQALRPGRLPLRLRLTLWFVLSLALILLALSLLLYWQVRRALIDQVDRALQLAAVQAGSAVIAQDTALAFASPGESPSLGSLSEEVAIRLLADDGSLWDSLGRSVEVPPIAPTSGYQTYREGDDTWRVYARPVTQSGLPIRGWLQVTQSLEPADQTLVLLGLQLLGGVPLALLLAGGGGYFLAWRALRPIDRITRTAQSIHSGDLSQRIGYRGPADELGRLAATFDKMLDRLQTAFDRERRFTADAAHELRTPLTALKGRLGVALSQPRGPAEYRTALEELEPQVDRMIRLSSDLLFMARLDQGPSARREPIALPELLAAVVEQVRPLAQARSITLVDPAVGELTVSGDMDHLLRLFLNLLDNAVKFTPPGGQISIAAVRSGSKVSVTIRDTGPGIPVEARAHLFKRFYRVGSDRSRPEGQGGAGLGLAIAHEIARAHGGSLTVGSEDGSGTTVTVNLPLVAPGEGTPLPPRPDS